jgi:hypothetical protein
MDLAGFKPPSEVLKGAVALTEGELDVLGDHHLCRDFEVAGLGLAGGLAELARG